MKLHTAIATYVTLLVGTAMSGPALSQETVSISRFFGACEDAGTDISAATGEACIIQAIINSFSDTDNGVKMETREIEWSSLYDQVKAGYAAGSPPDIHVMHRSRIPEFADIGLLADLSGDLEAAGIDASDWEPRARDGVSHDGAIYAVPMDFHGNLWHVNMDILEEAGLVEDGQPVLPKSAEQLVAQARQVKERTGKDYLAMQLGEGDLGLFFILAMAWQQGAEMIVDGESNFNSPEMATAIQTLKDLIDIDAVNPTYSYADAQQSFLSGNAAAHVNGTWVVDQYNAAAASSDSALTNYYVAPLPTLFDKGATWGDSHSWSIPASLKEENPERYWAALAFLAFLSDNNLAWAKTGHMAVRTSVLNSEEYAALPHRSEYVGTSAIVEDLPRSIVAWAVRDAVRPGVQSTYLNDVPIDEALQTIDEDVQDVLDDL